MDYVDYIWQLQLIFSERETIILYNFVIVTTFIQWASVRNNLHAELNSDSMCYCQDVFSDSVGEILIHIIKYPEPYLESLYSSIVGDTVSNLSQK